SFVHRLPNDVHDTPERAVADGHADGRTGVSHLDTSHQAFRRVHSNGAHDGLTQVLSNFEHEVVRLSVDVRVGGGQRVENCRQLPWGKLNVHHGSDNLSDLAFCRVRHAN